MMAGTKDVIEMHGSLFETKCMKCDHVEVNRDHPIVEALRGRGSVLSFSFLTLIF